MRIEENGSDEFSIVRAWQPDSMGTKMSLQKLFLQAIVWVFILGCLMTAVNAQDVNSDSPPPETRMTPELLWRLGRLGDATISPDGKRVAYTVRRFNLADNEGLSDLYLANAGGGEASLVTEGWKSLSSLDWKQAGDGTGERIFFEGTPKSEADDVAKATNQAWSIEPESLSMVQLTSHPDGIANLKVSPNGKRLAFTVRIKMLPEPNEIYPDLPKADARIIDQLMYRHWNKWHDYKFSHIHVADLADGGPAGDPIDLMKDIKADCPMPPFGGANQFCWSPDGKNIAFTMKDVQDWAQSTNSDIYVVAADGLLAPKNVSEGTPGYDTNPTYSPDGKWLAYNSMERAGFEADRNRIMIYNAKSGKAKELTVGLDQNANHPTWMPDSASILFDSQRDGTNQLFKIEIEKPTDDPRCKAISKDRYNWGILGVFPDGKTVLTSRMNMVRPTELCSLSLFDGTSQVISDINGEIYKDLQLPKVEERYVEATDGEKIHCWVIYPPDFDPTQERKWPMLTYCQGGPQVQIGQGFSYRWNFHLMAAQGYVVLAPNRRGLPGFGRKWNDQISLDWGGQAMKDILSATDEMTAEPYIDNDRVGAVGASFGGYTVFWLMGNHRDRFCSMIAHCGVFNLESMYGSTEELFFADWELGGPYWKSEQSQAKYDEFSPNRFVGKWETPLLVIHGEEDFRVPVTQGMEAFTAAQIQKVPSRFLYFPDEGHWVTKPQNSVLWQRVFFDWLDRHCKPEDD